MPALRARQLVVNQMTVPHADATKEGTELASPYRRPQTKNDSDFWYLSLGEYNTLVRCTERGPSKDKINALDKLRRYAFAGAVMETDIGEDSALSCEQCKRRNKHCRVRKDSKTRRCALCRVRSTRCSLAIDVPKIEAKSPRSTTSGTATPYIGSEMGFADDNGAGDLMAAKFEARVRREMSPRRIPYLLSPTIPELQLSRGATNTSQHSGNDQRCQSPAIATISTRDELAPAPNAPVLQFPSSPCVTESGTAAAIKVRDIRIRTLEKEIDRLRTALQHSECMIKTIRKLEQKVAEQEVAMRTCQELVDDVCMKDRVA
ncbi:hypothetical protein K461DRAFT_306159 [Myriangium duriaei CBS 260.36]|uniref:Zn(2)-C6 fungal-type domain-containing protein n=1 Tax=Myriangium duriaei CBS 260.36 TaxID=1168546 RepID=A0A9P4J4X9_9PEZI|nr:hypothetical protein K461DRAFT_306159 [Myriangium duriaei CBS 260.36]